MMTPDIVIPSSEGTIIGHVDSIQTAADAARTIDRMLGRTPS